MMLVIGATWPLMLWFAKRVNDGGDEPWGLIPLLVALGFLWREWRQGNAPWQLSSLRSCSGAMVLLATALSTLHLPPLLRAMMAIFGVCLLIGLRRHAAIALLLLLSLPPGASVML